MRKLRMMNLSKKKQKELEAYSKRHHDRAMSSAISLLSLLEKEDELIERVKVMEAGLMAFAIQTEDKERSEDEKTDRAIGEVAAIVFKPNIGFKIDPGINSIPIHPLPECFLSYVAGAVHRGRADIGPDSWLA